MNIALLGGSFNPPHIGHLLAAQFVRACTSADEIWLMPSFRHPFGKELADFDHRLQMCRLLCEDTAGWLKASAVEREVGGEGWTVETLTHLVMRHPEHRFTWIIGSDILPDLPRWREFDRIRELSQVLVLYRAGYPAPEAFGPPLVQVSSTEIRDRLARGNDVGDLVPRRVLDYVRAYGLLGATKQP